jgi:retron-type reverse transcriptase
MKASNSNLKISSHLTLIKSYLTDRHFQVQFNSSISEIAPIKAGVPQGGILSPFLFKIYVADQPTMQQTIVADYADDKVILFINEDPLIASLNLQIYLNHLSEWYKNGK